MFGHWESQTRKLNRHYQSVRRLGLWNMLKRGLRRAVFNCIKSENSVNYGSSGEPHKELNEETHKMEEKTMYVNRISIKLDKKWTDGTEEFGAYNSVPVNFIGLADKKMEGLTDNGEPLAQGSNRFLGLQLTCISFHEGQTPNNLIRFGKGIRDIYNLTTNEAGAEPDVGRTQVENSIISGLDKKNIFKMYRNGDLKAHDITQRGTTDFTGSTEHFMLAKSATQVNSSKAEIYWKASMLQDDKNTDLGAVVTLEASIPDEVFLDKTTGIHGKYIPVIGQTFFVSPYFESLGEAHGRYCWIMTPTVFNSKGDIIELNH